MFKTLSMRPTAVVAALALPALATAESHNTPTPMTTSCNANGAVINNYKN